MQNKRPSKEACHIGFINVLLCFYQSTDLFVKGFLRKCINRLKIEPTFDGKKRAAKLVNVGSE